MKTRTGKLIAIAAAALVLAGCTEENMEDCLNGSLNIKVVTAELSGHDPLDPSCIDKATVYIFDGDNTMVGGKEVEIDKVTPLDDTGADKLHFVAIGNVNDGVNEKLTSCQVSDLIGTGRISLIEKGSYKEHTLHNCPSDLFWGCKTAEIEKSRKERVIEVPVSRVVSSAKITMINIKQHIRDLGYSNPDDVYVVVSTNHKTIDYNGNPSGGVAAYNPSGNYKSDKEFVVPAFNMISSGQGEEVSVHIYSGGQLIESITPLTHPGTPLKAYNGKLLNILIDFTGTLSIQFEVSQWGDETVWKVIG